MPEVQPIWNQRLEAVASSAAAHFDVIRPGAKLDIDPTKPIVYGDENYYKLIAVVIGQGGVPYNPNKERIASVINAFTFGQSGRLAKAAQSAIFESYVKLPPETIENNYKQKKDGLIDSVTGVIDWIAQVEEDSEKRDAMHKVSEGITQKDEWLKLKLMIDFFQYSFETSGTNRYQSRRVFQHFSKAAIEELKTADPKDLTVELLTKVNNYGLDQIVDLYSFFNGASSADEVGTLYDREVSGYSQFPKRTDISTLPYEVRMLEWKEKRDTFEEEKVAVADELSKLTPPKEPQELKYGQVNDNWTEDNLPLIKEIMDGVLDRPILAEILKFGDTHSTFKYRSASIFGVRTSPLNLTGIPDAMRAVYEVASTNPTESNIRLLSEVMVNLKRVGVGLYQLRDTSI